MSSARLLVFAGMCIAVLRCGTGCAIEREDLYKLLEEDPVAFTVRITAGERDDLGRARAVVTWLTRNFVWSATDYKVRTVEQIIARRGGNCAELAQVSVALLHQMGLSIRNVREVNLHRASEERQRAAEEKVNELGNSLSVFGAQHNDHVWIEIYDRDRRQWFPADPSLGVVGEKEWLLARLGFGERFTLDRTSQDMIAPFALFVFDEKGGLVEDRTAYYLIERFGSLYGGKVARLAAWPRWKKGVEDLSKQALKAFQGSVNLHQFKAEIAELVRVYAALKHQYLTGSNSEPTVKKPARRAGD